MRSVSPDASATPGGGALKESAAAPAEAADNNVTESQADADETSANGKPPPRLPSSPRVTSLRFTPRDVVCPNAFAVSFCLG